jgi:hypothetical protein
MPPADHLRRLAEAASKRDRAPEDDLAYLAALSPEVVLALLDVMEKARVVADTYAAFPLDDDVSALASLRAAIAALDGAP